MEIDCKTSEITMFKDGIAVRVPRAVKKRIEREARARMLAGADIVREAVVKHLDELDAARKALETPVGPRTP